MQDKKQIQIQAVGFITRSLTSDLKLELLDPGLFTEREVGLEISIGQPAGSASNSALHSYSVRLEVSGRASDRIKESKQDELTMIASINLTQLFAVADSQSDASTLESTLLEIGWTLVRPILVDSLLKMGMQLSLPFQMTANHTDL